MERLSELVSENLMSGWWEGLWERIIEEQIFSVSLCFSDFVARKKKCH